MSTVLVVEDEPTLRRMMALELEEAGQTVLQARDGEEAVASLAQQEPDIVLLDLIMPRMDGYAVLRHMKERGIGCPVVVMSNIADPDEMKKCQSLGAREFLVKSQLDSDQLWPLVSSFL